MRKKLLALLFLLAFYVTNILAFLPSLPRSFPKTHRTLANEEDATTVEESNKFMVFLNKRPPGYGMTIGQAMLGGIIIEIGIFYVTQLGKM